MTRPPERGSGQPWWQRPGGAPSPGQPQYPPPRPPQYPPQRPSYPPPQRPSYPPEQPQRPQYQPPQQQPGWPQQQYYQQPVQPPQQPPAAPQPGKPAQSRLPMIAGAVVAIVVVGVAALVGGLWLSGSIGGGTVLDVGQAEAGVKQILTDPINGYGANEVSSVKCNDGEDPEVKQGESFSCDVTINGAKRKVQVVFADDAGTYEVDGPR